MPQELLSLPSKTEFRHFVDSRLPFIIRGSQLQQEGETPRDALNTLLDWKTSSWVDDSSYLIDQVNSDKNPDDDDLTVLVERKRRPSPTSSSSQSDELFGFGVNVHSTHIPFIDFLQSYYCYRSDQTPSSSLSSDPLCPTTASPWIEYLNVQDIRDSNGSIWRPPLSLPSLKKDIPIPGFLQEFVDDGTLSDINLWMGNTQSLGGLFSLIAHSLDSS
jgi:hypothetical protein